MKFFLYVFLLIFLSVFFKTFAQTHLSPEILWKLKRIQNVKISPNKQFLLFEQTSYSTEKNNSNTDLFLLNLNDKTIHQLTENSFHENCSQWNFKNEIYYLSNESGSNQIWKIDTKNKEKKQVSFVKEIEIEDFKLSNNGNKILIIAPVKMKSTLKEKHPDLPLINARLEDDLMYRHWNHWQDENKIHLLLFDLQNEKLSEGYKDILESQFYDGISVPFGGNEDVCFSYDDKQIIYSCKKKKGKAYALSTNSDIYSYTIDNNTTKNISEESKGYDTHPKFSPKGKYMSYLSMKKEGFEADKNDLILYDNEKQSKKNISQHIDLTIDEYCFSEDEKNIYFLAPFQGSKQIFHLNLDNLEWEQITKNEQDFLSIDLVENDLISLRQTFVDPTDIFSINLKSLREKNLSSVNREILSKLELPTYQERWIETSDGKKMLVWIIYPPNFDQNKKYPSVLYCQGGPQSMVSQFFSYRWNLALLASQGYIIIAPNRRGLPGFGQQWNDEISKDWGGQAIKDYLSAVDNISNEPYIDINRIGAVGASYGGYSVYYLAGIHNGRFKTFISHCGLFNLESWYGTTEELFFANWDNKGPYWLPENKEYYQKNSPHNFVQNWNTPMLVIHGGMDFRVPETEGMQAFQALQLKGIRSKYLYFPKESHWVTSPQNSILWYREFIEWLDTDLKK